MLISFLTTNSYTDNVLLKILLDWRFLFCILCCILILLYCCKKLFTNENLKQRLENDDHQLFKTSEFDTIRQIPTQTSALKRRPLVSKPLKRNNKKSLSKPNKSRRITKTNPPVDSSSSIKISLILSKENTNDKQIDHNSLLTIEDLKSKRISRSISIEFPLTDSIHDVSNTMPITQRF